MIEYTDISCPSYGNILGSGRLDFPKFHSIVANNQPMKGPGMGIHPDRGQGSVPSSLRVVFALVDTEEEVVDHFGVFDTYKDGHIDAADLVYLLRELGEPLTEGDVNSLLKEITVDGDKRVNIR